MCKIWIDSTAEGACDCIKRFTTVVTEFVLARIEFSTLTAEDHIEPTNSRIHKRPPVLLALNPLIDCSKIKTHESF